MPDEVPPRAPLHRRDAQLEALLPILNRIVEAGARADVPRWENVPEHPIVFIVGCGRSGTTLLMQWLADSGRFAYPTNLASRLYASPRVGAMLHRVLVELDHRHEILPPPDAADTHRSLLGKTRGAHQPNEYWYWWRRFFPFGDLQTLSEEALAAVDVARMRHELADYGSVFGKPVVMKAMIMNWHLPFLAQVFERSIFLHVSRDVVANAASLLHARREFYGDPGAWYSFKPPEYTWLRTEAPEVQAVGQVLANERAVHLGLEGLPPSRVLRVAYEAFCQRPSEVWGRLRTSMVDLGGPELGAYEGPSQFGVGREEKHPDPALDRALTTLRSRFQVGSD